MSHYLALAISALVLVLAVGWVVSAMDAFRDMLDRLEVVDQRLDVLEQAVAREGQR